METDHLDDYFLRQGLTLCNSHPPTTLPLATSWGKTAPKQLVCALSVHDQPSYPVIVFSPGFLAHAEDYQLHLEIRNT